jgi:ribonuclease HII
LAGPVVAAAVILPAFPRLKGLNDSKVMTEVQRELLFPAIKGTALAVSVAVIEPAIIDELNILNATLKAMRHALAALKVRPDLALIDGNQRPGSGVAESLIVKGDSKSASIMAASIIAKVTRDRIMVKIHDQYPEYGFSEHKGYSVPSHLEALKKFGPCAAHRRSFGPVKQLLHQNLPSVRSLIYDRGESPIQAELF